jgi:hypothetical protein
MAEFAPALFVFILMLFPLINLIGYGMAVATAQLVGRQTAQAAGTANTFTLARTAMQTESNNMLGSAWGQFAKLSPNGGYSGSGADLYVTITPVSGGPPTKNGPNVPYGGTVNTTTYIYEYTTSVHYTIRPFVPLGTFPFIGNVPIIGQAAQFNIDSSCAAEFPDGITQ